MSKKRQHVHQYIKIYPHAQGKTVINKINGVWACALPDCTHYMPHNVEGQVEGKMSRCNRCMEYFILDQYNMQNDRPMCDTCANPSGIVIPESYDPEKMEVRTYLANKSGRELHEVTDAEIEHNIQLRRIAMNKM